MSFLIRLSLLLCLCSAASAQAPTRDQKMDELRKSAKQYEELQRRLEKLGERRDELAQELLAVDEEDEREAARLGAKAVRLYPDGALDPLVDLQDQPGASVYPFTEIADLYFAPRLRYKNGALGFDDESGRTHGFVLDLGGKSFAQFDEESREFVALAKYLPPSDAKDAGGDFTADGLTFRRRARVAAGAVYLVRAVGYGEGDGVFLVKVQRLDSDESIVVFVKLLKKFDAPELKKEAARRAPVTSETAAVDAATAQKMQLALLEKGFPNVSVDISTVPATLRGTVPKGKMAEAISLAQEASGKPLQNQLTEQ